MTGNLEVALGLGGGDPVDRDCGVKVGVICSGFFCGEGFHYVLGHTGCRWLFLSLFILPSSF